MNSSRLLICLLLAASCACGDQILGRIESVDGQSATIDVGKAAGVLEKMVFEVWSNPRMVEIPITGDVVYQEMEVVASLVVVDVRDNHAVCRIENFEAVGALVTEQLRVAQNPVRPEQEQPPFVVEFTASGAGGEWNQTLDLTINASDPNGGRLVYTWSTDRGKLKYRTTTAPRNVWTSPLESGPCEVTVVVRDPTGRTCEAKKTLRSGGMTRGWRPTRFPFQGHFGDHKAIFTKVADIACDSWGMVYVLDREQRTVVQLDEGWNFVTKFGPYDDDYDFFRLEVRDKQVYLLDKYSRAAYRFPLDSQETFTSNDPVQFGKGGDYGINGELYDPVDLEVNRLGELYVLDKHTGTVQLFDAEGNFQLSLGTKANGSEDGQLEAPVAIALDPNERLVVLDDGQIKKAVVFENHRPAFQIRLGDAKEKMAGVDFDPTTGLMLVLSNTGGDVNLRPLKALPCRKGRPEIRPFGQMLGEDNQALESMHDVSRVKVGPNGDVYVVARNQSELFRYAAADAGQTTWRLTGKWGGEAYTMSYVTKVAADSDGNVACLAPSLSTVLVMDKLGWIKAKFGHMGEGSDRLREPIDLASDVNGNIYVLDGEYQNVRKYSPTGGIPVPIGNAGSGGGQISYPKDIAVRDGKVFVLLERETNCILSFGPDNRVVDSFPAAPDDMLETPGSIGVMPRNLVVAACNYNVKLRSYRNSTGSFSASDSHTVFEDLDVFDDLVGMNSGLLGVVARDTGFGTDYYVAVLDDDVRLIGQVTDNIEANCPYPSDIAADGFGMMYILDAENHRIAMYRCQR